MPAPDVLGAYRAAVALESFNYRLAPDVLQELIAKLRATPRSTAEAAIKGTPSRGFIPGPTRKPPRIVRRGGDTFARPASATSARP